MDEPKISFTMQEASVLCEILEHVQDHSKWMISTLENGNIIPQLTDRLIDFLNEHFEESGKEG